MVDFESLSQVPTNSPTSPKSADTSKDSVIRENIAGYNISLDGNQLKIIHCTGASGGSTPYTVSATTTIIITPQIFEHRSRVNFINNSEVKTIGSRRQNPQVYEKFVTEVLEELKTNLITIPNMTPRQRTLLNRAIRFLEDL